MGDLPGPKMRIGQLAEEPVELKPGDIFTLTTECGGWAKVSDSARQVSGTPLVLGPNGP
jgi:pyruvate kinase